MGINIFDGVSYRNNSKGMMAFRKSIHEPFKHSAYNAKVRKQSIQEKIFPIGFFVVLLTGFQLTRIKIGPLPIYFSEIFALFLLLKSFSNSKNIKPPANRQIPVYYTLFFIFIFIGEVHGAIAYGFFLPAIFQIYRYGLGVFLIFSLPRLIKTDEQFNILLRAVVIGIIITASLSIFSSLPVTRPFARICFSNPFVDSSKARGLEKYDQMRGEQGVRGSSLIGPAPFTGAYLCILWPLSVLAHQRSKNNKKWKTLSAFASIIAPIGALMTYSRMSYLGIILILGVVALFGKSGSRKLPILFIIMASIVLGTIGLHSKYFYFERIQNRTIATFDDPLSSADVSERFLSYTEAIKYFYGHPVYLFCGAGSAGDKMADRGEVSALIYDQLSLPTHSAFAWSIYGFGLGGGLCQLALMMSSLILILKNILSVKRKKSDGQSTWPLLFAVWLGGLLPWWLFGHGVVSTARGAMFMAFIFSIFLVCEQLGYQNVANSKKLS